MLQAKQCPGRLEWNGAFTNQGTLDTSQAVVYLDGNLNNAGSTLTLDNETGSLYLIGGGILGGTITTSGAATLVAANDRDSDGANLSGVTLEGSLQVGAAPFTSAVVTISDGLTLEEGTINVTATGLVVFLLGSETLGGNGTVNLSGGDGQVEVPQTADVLTIAAGVTVLGSGALGANNQGLITNQGAVEAGDGGTLTVEGDTNFGGGTLTGGTWGAVGNSTLDLIGANITSNAASLLLDGASSHIDSNATGKNALAGLVTNTSSGSFTVQNGASFQSPAAFTNAGSLIVNAGGTFTPGGAGVFTQNGGSTTLDSGTLGTAGSQLNFDGGTLSGPGAIDGNLTNNALVDLGAYPGILTVNGNYTQSSSGTLILKVGGDIAGGLFDQVNVSGTATLGGTLDVSSIDNFAPVLEEVFPVLTFASASGSFAAFNSPLINGTAAFGLNALPTGDDLVGATLAPDLAVTNISFTPANALLNQNVSVTYTVANLGTVAATEATWTDSVYLSIDPTIDANAVLLGRVSHSGNVAGLSQYTATMTAAVPGLAPGSYRVIVVADSALQVPDTNRANNTAVSTTELSVQHAVPDDWHSRWPGHDRQRRELVLPAGCDARDKREPGCDFCSGRRSRSLSRLRRTTDGRELGGFRHGSERLDPGAEPAERPRRYVLRLGERTRGGRSGPAVHSRSQSGDIRGQRFHAVLGWQPRPGDDGHHGIRIHVADERQFGGYNRRDRKRPYRDFDQRQ